MPLIHLQGSQVHYRTQGEGDQAIIFLHGGFGSSSELWDQTMTTLPPGWRGFAIDNFMHSEAPLAGYSVKAFASRLLAFADAMGLKAPVIAGHSMGGVVCQLAAAASPARYAGVVLVCTGASMTNHTLGRELLHSLREHGQASLLKVSMQWFRTPPPNFFEAYVARACTVPLQAMIDVQQSLIDTDCRPLLAGINAPTLVVFGQHDSGRTIDHARTLLAGIPNSRLATMTDSGHSPMVETPEAFEAALHNFLATLPQPELLKETSTC